MHHLRGCYSNADNASKAISSSCFVFSWIRKKTGEYLSVCSKGFMGIWCTVKANSCHNSVSTVQLKGGLSHVHM